MRGDPADPVGIPKWVPMEIGTSSKFLDIPEIFLCRHALKMGIEFGMNLQDDSDPTESSI